MEKQDYEWVKQTRLILLEQCKELSEGDFAKELGFGFQSIKDTLVHIAGCYHAWLGSFVLSETKTPLLSKETVGGMKIEDIRRYFLQADKYVDTVFDQFAEKYHDTIDRVPPWRTRSESVSKTPYQLLIHSITHEFHHKGQISAMLRMLGHTPKNTDILGLPGRDSLKEGKI